MTKLPYSVFFALLLLSCFVGIKTCEYFFSSKKITKELREEKPSANEPIQTLMSQPKPENAFPFLSEKTQEILKAPCGKCHQSSLKSSLAGALAIFDLDKKMDWYETLKPENYEGVISRVKKNDAILESDKELVLQFIEALK